MVKISSLFGRLCCLFRQQDGEGGGEEKEREIGKKREESGVVGRRVIIATFKRIYICA